ncbi:MAG: metallophosphoesterase, partial [Parasporobacterium sp.]|nr:metallophosphoesterase [Parasporobacterium sp.]
MSTGAIVLTVIGCIIILIAVRAVWELKHPKVTVLKVVSPKVRNNTRIVYLSDLHGRSYGENNAQLIELIKQQNPDYIFLGGDLAVASPGKTDETAINFIKEVCLISPVFYAPGNHEKHLAINPGLFGGRYNAIKEAVIQSGGTYLENASVSLKDNMVLYGLDIDFRYYVKFRKAPFLTEPELNNCLGDPDKEKFNILLAHSPKYFRTYAAWGADLSFSGHYHGGLM